MSNTTSSSSGGIVFSGLLCLPFIVLKLTHVLAWSWLWVLSPLWINPVLILGILLIVVAVAALK